jgi:hypothetical protein
MTFSNPAANAAAAAPAYTRALLNLLGNRDPFEVLGELGLWLRRTVTGLDDDTLRRWEAPGKWSAIEVVQHLADTELVLGYRARMALSEDHPPLRAFNQDQWAILFHYRDAPLNVALDQLLGLRAGNLRVWRSLSPDQFERVGLHAERGPESVIHMLRMAAGHDLVHRRQIERVLASVK